MTEDFARFVMDNSGPRMVGDGVAYPDLLRLRERIGDWSQWYEEWSALARSYERRAAEALERGAHISAGELYFRSSITWQYCQFLWFHQPQEREEGQHQKVAMYRKAAPLLRPPAERVEIPFEGTSIPAYFRLPEGEDRPPVVVEIGGLESTKEEAYLFENMCLKRGIATIAFDGPGQGEYFFQRPMQPDFERYASGVVDYMVTRNEVDHDRIAVLGRSLGGHYSVRSAAFEPRFVACVAWGAMYDLDSYFDRMEPLTQRGLRYVTGIEDPEEAERAVRSMITLEGVAENVSVPLYIMHGVKDHLIPVEQALQLDQHTPNAAKTLAIEEEGDHCGHNIHHLVRPPIADWLANQLGASGQA